VARDEEMAVGDGSYLQRVEASLAQLRTYLVRLEGRAERGQEIGAQNLGLAGRVLVDDRLRVGA
jgi:hypothetical protein